MNILDRIYLGNSLLTWFLAIGVVILALVSLLAIRWIILHRLVILAQKTETELDDLMVDLLKSRIRNFKRMTERRVVFSVGVTYQTPHEKLAAIGPMIRTIIESQPGVRYDRAHFKEFGDSALVFEVVYYLLDPDYNLYMDTQQTINLELFRQFEAEGISFAYPTQTLFLARETAAANP